MTDPHDISIHDFSYDLPGDRVATHPLEERDASKLLVYKDGIIKDDIYKNIADHLPPGSLLIFNDSKVINARIRFQKPSGGIIEIFCLEPQESINDYSVIMNKTGRVQWKCLVGGASKWKSGPLHKRVLFQGREVSLYATVINKITDAYLVEFSWTPTKIPFSAILEWAGDVPLPPYIKRKPDTIDISRYQTIYALYDGSVAAPTAGLHFTNDVFEKLDEKNIRRAYVTLHVGAGTFRPVKADSMKDHEMHAEWIDVDVQTIREISEKSGSVIAVGTTSLRTLETLFWLGVKTFLTPKLENLTLLQWDVYESPLKETALSCEDALQSLIKWMESRNTTRLFIQTQLMVAPGYHFRIVKALVTNFHQPQSTLLLLVAAAAGKDWKKLYSHALDNEYRFLSYGDGNLIFIDDWDSLSKAE